MLGSMRLIDMVRSADRRLAVPLAGYPGIQITKSTVKQNEFNAELQTRSLYKLAERIQPDMIFTMMDLSTEAGALGMPVRYPIADSATVEWHPVKSVADLEQYKVVDHLYDGRVWVYLESVRLLRKKIKIPIGSYVIGPFTLAGLMMGANDIAIATIEASQVVKATVTFCENVVISFAKALLQAGADVIAILDPTAGMLSPKSYWEFAGKSVQNVIRHLDTRAILHICGDTTRLVKNMCETGAQGLSLDALVNFAEIAKRIPSDVVLIGNVDPVGIMLKGTPEQVRKQTNALLDSMARVENFIPSTGCDLPAETPIANVTEFVKTVKEWKK